MKLILPTGYAIKFNTEFVPPDFDKWIKLDTSGYEKNYQFLLNDYSSVVIKSKEQNILLRLAGINYSINQNHIYFPFFPIYSHCHITLSPNIDIYINPNLNINVNNELNQPLTDNDVIFYNMKIIDESSKLIGNDKNLLATQKMIGLTTRKYIEIDIEKFYYEYEKENNKLLYVDKILLNEKIVRKLDILHAKITDLEMDR